MKDVYPLELSLLVPVHDPDGEYASFLTELLSSVKEQSLLPDEVLIVSNHAISYEQDLVEQAGPNLAIRFERSEASNAPENINAGVKRVRGRITKILFQDDYLGSPESLARTVAELNKSGRSWIATGCDHFSQTLGLHSPHKPRLSRKLIRGANYVGAPSVIAFRTEDYVPMNTSLRYVFDCDWYLRMWHARGRLATLSDTLVTIRLHSGQATHWARSLLGEEVKTMKVAHNRGLTTTKPCVCVTR
jgi:glycosyltransferase involved in cell wall biosynthesis